MEWISVRDRLPEKCTSVIAYGQMWTQKDEWVVTECFFDKKESFCFRDEFVSLNRCTHWMLLPEPLKDKE